jgi:LmbE family N-acetylglucosaminyl deacetylase
MNVLVIAAHADDETLGCGGTLLQHRRREDAMDWLIASSPWEPRWQAEEIERKAADVQRVANAYRIREVVELGHRSGELELVPVRELMSGIERAVLKTRPEIVYLVHPGDVHTDHGAVFTAVMSVLKPFRMAHLGVRRILAYETLSSSDAAARPSFAPTVFVDISGELEEKLRVMALYRSELQPEPLPRSVSSIRALARHRGATVAVEYAESFVLVRELARPAEGDLANGPGPTARPA